MHTSRTNFGIKAIAFLLVAATVVTLIPRNSAANAFTSEPLLSDNSGFITAEDAENYSIVSRDSTSEIDLNSIILNT